MTTRAEHLAFCKERALAYVDRGDLLGAITSMMSDMNKHPETKNPGLDSVTMGLLLVGALDTPEQVRRHINGYT